jgi:hypothetical protein
MIFLLSGKDGTIPLPPEKMISMNKLKILPITLKM